MVSLIIYLLFVNLTKIDKHLLPHNEGNDDRPKIYKENVSSSIENITISIEKKNLLKQLQDNSTSVFKKISIIEMYFDKYKKNEYIYDIKQGGLFKNTDFDF
jgi:hypothetical protein